MNEDRYEGKEHARVTAYDAWYDAPRGRWIGESEFLLLRTMTGLGLAESVLDVGCGTGWFTRRFAETTRGEICGIDPDEAALAFAREHAVRGEAYEPGRGEELPFDDRSWDAVVSVAALCFMEDERRAVAEMVRVARRTVALGLLNRHSLLWWRKGRGGGSGAYRGARWHTAAEGRELFAGLPVRTVRVGGAIRLAGGGPVARWVDAMAPARCPGGAFLCVVAEVESWYGEGSVAKRSGGEIRGKDNLP